MATRKGAGRKKRESVGRESKSRRASAGARMTEGHATKIPSVIIACETSTSKISRASLKICISVHGEEDGRVAEGETGCSRENEASRA